MNPFSVVDLDKEPLPAGAIIEPMPDGMVLTSCPHYLVKRAVAVGEVSSAYYWREKNALGIRYPNGVPLVLCHAIDAFGAGIYHGTKELMKDQARERNGK